MLRMSESPSAYSVQDSTILAPGMGSTTIGLLDKGDMEMEMEREWERERKRRVIVIGAGVEGLTTALAIRKRWPSLAARTGLGRGFGGLSRSRIGEDIDGEVDVEVEGMGMEVEVEIVADVMPEDPKSVGYTSHWAGAHYVSSSPPGTREAEIASVTFREMWDLSAPANPDSGSSSGSGEGAGALAGKGARAEECFLRLVQTELYAEGNTEEGWVNPFEGMPEYHELTETELAPFVDAGVEAVSGFSFRTVTIDVPVYLRYLTDRAREEGVRFVRGHVQHINQVLEGGSGIFESKDESLSSSASTSTSAKLGTTPIGGGGGGGLNRKLHPDPPDAVIVCVGLGARSLGGVEDAAVYPSRGQTVILRAPWVRIGRTFEDEVNKTWTYIIPRRGGNVVVGGVLGAGDWYPKARPETTRDLLERGLRLCPELVPPETRTRSGKGTIDDLLPLIVEEGCGLRPMRKGGARIELEYMNVPGDSVAHPDGNVKRNVAVVHNYGHGTRGYIQSIGSAELVVGLLEEAFML